MSIFWIFLAILIIQRLSELLLACRNERVLRAKGAVEYDERGYRWIVLMHVMFLLSFVAEYTLLSRSVNRFWVPLLIIFLLAQGLRYWAISTLGERWNTKILVIPSTDPLKLGPYKYLNHPNYAAVVTEIAVIPLLFSCYITAAVFSVLNLLVLRRRIRIEEQALSMPQSE